MRLVQKDNKQLRATDDRLAAMLSAGYVEIDEKTGKPIKAARPDEKAALKKENADLKKENADLKARIQALEKPAE